MTVWEFEELLARLAKGWSARDYDAVAENFAENLYYSDPLNYVFRDRQSLLAFFRDDGGRPQRCLFRNSLFDEDQQVGAAEYTYEGTFCYHGTVWIEMSEGKIASWREYQHRDDRDWEEFWQR